MKATKILITGGCGYIGAKLIPWLLADGWQVTVYDTQWLGHGFLPDNPKVTTIKGDVRFTEKLVSAAVGHDVVLWLASVSNNDVCVEQPKLAERVNFDAFANFVTEASKADIKRTIYASSVAAYGSSDADAKEGDVLKPTTPYAHAKADAENWLYQHGKGTVCVTRMASVCGYSPRMRFDLTVNKMVHDAMRYGVIKVNGGSQKRSHINIHDACRAYRMLTRCRKDLIAGQTFNFVGQNQTVLETAQIVSAVTKKPIEVGPATDDRSYTVDGTKAKIILDWEPKKDVEHAVYDIKARFDGGMWADSESQDHYWNKISGVV